MIPHGYISHCCQFLSQHLLNNKICQAGVQKESHHSGEPLLYLITVPEVRQVATAWGHEFQADISFFLGKDTDIAFFIFPSLSQHRLDCARGMPKLDITAATTLTITTSSFTAQGMIVLGLLPFIHRELPLELPPPQPLQLLPDPPSSEGLGVSSSTTILGDK